VSRSIFAEIPLLFPLSALELIEELPEERDPFRR